MDRRQPDNTALWNTTAGPRLRGGDSPLGVEATHGGAQQRIRQQHSSSTDTELLSHLLLGSTSGEYPTGGSRDAPRPPFPMAKRPRLSGSPLFSAQGADQPDALPAQVSPPRGHSIPTNLQLTDLQAPPAPFAAMQLPPPPPFPAQLSWIRSSAGPSGSGSGGGSSRNATSSEARQEEEDAAVWMLLQEIEGDRGADTRRRHFSSLESHIATVTRAAGPREAAAAAAADGWREYSSKAWQYSYQEGGGSRGGGGGGGSVGAAGSGGDGGGGGDRDRAGGDRDRAGGGGGIGGRGHGSRNREHRHSRSFGGSYVAPDLWPPPQEEYGYEYDHEREQEQQLLQLQRQQQQRQQQLLQLQRRQQQRQQQQQRRRRRQQQQQRQQQKGQQRQQQQVAPHDAPIGPQSAPVEPPRGMPGFFLGVANELPQEQEIWEGGVHIGWGGGHLNRSPSSRGSPQPLPPQPSPWPAAWEQQQGQMPIAAVHGPEDQLAPSPPPLPLSATQLQQEQPAEFSMTMAGRELRRRHLEEQVKLFQEFYRQQQQQEQQRHHHQQPHQQVFATHFPTSRPRFDGLLAAAFSPPSSNSSRADPGRGDDIDSPASIDNPASIAQLDPKMWLVVGRGDFCSQAVCAYRMGNGLALQQHFHALCGHGIRSGPNRGMPFQHHQLEMALEHQRTHLPLSRGLVGDGSGYRERLPLSAATVAATEQHAAEKASAAAAANLLVAELQFQNTQAENAVQELAAARAMAAAAAAAAAVAAGEHKQELHASEEQPSSAPRPRRAAAAAAMAATAAVIAAAAAEDDVDVAGSGGGGGNVDDSSSCSSGSEEEEVDDDDESADGYEEEYDEIAGVVAGSSRRRGSRRYGGGGGGGGGGGALAAAAAAIRPDIRGGVDDAAGGAHIGYGGGAYGGGSSRSDVSRGFGGGYGGNVGNYGASGVTDQFWGPGIESDALVHVEDHDPSEWSAEESDLLRNLVEEMGTSAWSRVAMRLPGKSEQQCMLHWRQVLNRNRTVKGIGSWSPEEDSRLFALVAELGGRWALVAQRLPGRIPKQCRERYINHLDPTLKSKNEPWTAQEEALLLHLCQPDPATGKRPPWAQICRGVPGRSYNDVKNHYNLMQRRRQKEERVIAAGVRGSTAGGTSGGDGTGSGDSSGRVGRRRMLGKGGMSKQPVPRSGGKHGGGGRKRKRGQEGEDENSSD